MRRGDAAMASAAARPATASRTGGTKMTTAMSERPPRPATAKGTNNGNVGGSISSGSGGGNGGNGSSRGGRPMTAKVDRHGGTTSYMAGANLWGAKKKERVRPATAQIKSKSRKVIKVRNLSHLQSSKPNFKGLTPGALHSARDGYIYPSSRPASGTSQSLYHRDTGASPASQIDSYDYDRNAIYAYGGLRRRRRERPSSSASYASSASRRSRPGSSHSYGAGAGQGNYRHRPQSGYQISLTEDAFSDFGESSYIDGGGGDDTDEEEERQSLRYPPWRRAPNTDAFARHSAKSAFKPQQLAVQNGSSDHSNHQSGRRSRPVSSRSVLSSRSVSRSLHDAGGGYRPSTAGSMTSSGTTDWSRPSSRGDRVGTRGNNAAGNMYEDFEPEITWQIRESRALESGYGQLGIAPNRKGLRPTSAASTHSRGSRKTEVRPTSPESLVPHPQGGKLRSRHGHLRSTKDPSRTQSSSKNERPWDVHLSSTVPRPRNALAVVAPPTAPQRRPTTASERSTQVVFNSRPWSTDAALKARTKASKSPAVIHLADGRPHTVGVTRDSLPYNKVVTYREAFDLTGSHVEARRMMDTQHRMIKESRVRDYENWQSDKTTLQMQKVASRRWGTTGEASMENPVTRAMSRDIENRHKKLANLVKPPATAPAGSSAVVEGASIRQFNSGQGRLEERSAHEQGSQKYPASAPRKRTRSLRGLSSVAAGKGKTQIVDLKGEWRNGWEKPESTLRMSTDDSELAGLQIRDWRGEHFEAEGPPLLGELAQTRSELSAESPSGLSIPAITPKKEPVDKNHKAFHEAMMTSYGTGEIEVLWLKLTEIPRSVIMSTLALQCQHLVRFSVGGNLIKRVPSWLFPNLHSLLELNLSNNKLTKIPENIEMLEGLTRLRCCYNQISELPSTLVHLWNLTELDCTGNCISSLPRRLGSLSLLKVFRMGDNNLKFLSGGVENLVSLRELVLTRNRLGTLAMITPLSVRIDTSDDVWEKSRLPKPQGGGVIFFNRRTTETLRRPPQGATVLAAQGYESEEEQDVCNTSGGESRSSDAGQADQVKADAWRKKVEKRAVRLKLRDELAEQGKGIWEVKWTMFTGRAYYFNHFEKRRSDVMPRELDRIGMLPSIRRLVISFNVLQELPPSIGRLETLEELILDHNKLVELPTSIGGLMNLRILSLTDNRLEALPPQLRTLDRLRTINGTYNHISKIPVEIGELTALEKLWLSNNKIAILPSEMYRMASLEEIFLSDNPLVQPALSVVEKGVPFFLRECKERWLRDNKLGQPPGVTLVGTGVRGEIVVPEPRYRKAIKDILIRAIESRTLEMQWKELHAVPSAVWDITELRELRLQNNLLTAAAFTVHGGTKGGAPGLHTFSNLMLLSLSNNQLHEFPIILLKCTSIENLDLSNNFIPGLPEKMHRMYRLRSLNLSQNRLARLPEKFGSLVELTYLNLDINHIGPTLPASFCALHKLKTLKLVKNRLQSLPIAGMAELTSLTLLNLNSNRIGPSLPDDMSFMPSLSELFLSHNRIKTLSPEFCQSELTTSLTKLWLYGNRVVQLPHAFRFLTSLVDLRLENNPMRSPPPELALQGPGRILRYCDERLGRIEDFKRIIREEHIRFNPDNLIPKSAHVFTEGTDYLTPDDLAEFDDIIDRTLNGPYYNFDIDVPGLVIFMGTRKQERRVAFHKILLERFLIFVETALSARKLDARFFREDMHRPWGEEQKDEEVYSLVLEPLYEVREGLELPSVQRVIDLETAERRSRAEDTPPPTPGREPPRNSIMDVTNDIFRTKGKPMFRYPLWQVREAISEWVGPFGRVAQIEHGIKFRDPAGFEKFRLLLEILEEKIQRQRGGAEKARKRIARLARSTEAEARKMAEADAAIAIAQAHSQGDGENAGLSEGVGEERLTVLVSSENAREEGELTPDEQIIRAYDSMVAEAKLLRDKMMSCEESIVNDVIVIVKAIFTLEEVRRQHEEEKDLELAEKDARMEVLEWLQTKFGKKALLTRLKEVRKFHKGQLKVVRKEIKKILAMKPKMKKDLAAMMKRKKAFDKGKRIEFHRFETLNEAEEAVAMVQQPLDEALAKVDELRELEQSRIELTKQPKELLLRQAEIDLCDKYAYKTRRHTRDEARVDARKRGLRRPWDGPNGRAFRMWCEEQDNLLERMLDPPSDTPLSSSSTDVSTDTEPEVDTQTAAGIAKRKAWEAKHKLKLEANKYKWSRILTDSQKERKKQKAEDAKKLLYKFGEAGDDRTEEEKATDATERAAEGDDEASSDDELQIEDGSDSD